MTIAIEGRQLLSMGTILDGDAHFQFFLIMALFLLSRSLCGGKGSLVSRVGLLSLLAKDWETEGLGGRIL